MNKVYYFMIIVFLVGIFVYAQINRYRLYSAFNDSASFIMLDTWTGRAFLRLVTPEGGTWVDLGRPKAEKILRSLNP